MKAEFIARSARPSSRCNRLRSFSRKRGFERGPERIYDSGLEHRRQAELLGLRDAAVGVGDGPQLAGEPELAEAGKRPARDRGAQRPSLGRAGDC
jgi:hypothetical protein